MNSIKVKQIFKALLVVLGVVATGSCFAATDVLAEFLKPEVSAIFGENSYFVYLIYLAEFFTCVLVYSKNKNPMALTSIPIFIAATHFFYIYTASLSSTV